MKRFYKEVTVAVAIAAAEGGYQVMLDGRAIRTVGGRPQIVPGAALAHALAAEWAEQGDEIDPARFVYRDMADLAIDVIATDRAGAVASLLPYAETDTLCYRGDEGEALHARQLTVWEPLLIAAEQRWDIHFTRISGILHQPQPAETLARLRAVLETQDNFALAALKTTASLAASLVIGLAALEPDADAKALWDIANLEEDWQAELWGKDGEAMALREKRQAIFAAAMRFAGLAGAG